MWEKQYRQHVCNNCCIGLWHYNVTQNVFIHYDRFAVSLILFGYCLLFYNEKSERAGERESTKAKKQSFRCEQQWDAMFTAFHRQRILNASIYLCIHLHASRWLIGIVSRFLYEFPVGAFNRFWILGYLRNLRKCMFVTFISNIFTKIHLAGFLSLL